MAGAIVRMLCNKFWQLGKHFPKLASLFSRKEFAKPQTTESQPRKFWKKYFGSKGCVIMNIAVCFLGQISILKLLNLPDFSSPILKDTSLHMEIGSKK